MQNDTEGHETDARVASETLSMSMADDHEVPFQVWAPGPPAPGPVPTNSTQNDAEKHETDKGASAEPTVLDHDVPFHVPAPVAPAAMQNDAEEHETQGPIPPQSPPAVSAVGEDHEMPFQVRLFPSKSTAMQNEADGHEIEVTASSVKIPEDHEDPFQVRAIPPACAMQNDADAQETAETSCSGILPDDHEAPFQMW
jgi:hypothetical protein